MLDHLLESSHRDDSNKWSNIGFGEEIRHVAWIEVIFMCLIWSSGSNCIKGFDGYRHLTGIFWPTRFDVTIETIVSIVTSNLIGQN